MVCRLELSLEEGEKIQIGGGEMYLNILFHKYARTHIERASMHHILGPLVHNSIRSF